MQRDLRKRELLEAATRVLARSGSKGLSARAVAEEAGVSPGSVIYHFGDMEALMLAVVTGVLEQFAEERRVSVTKIEAPIDRIRMLIVEGVPEVVDGPLRTLYEQIGYVREHPESVGLHRSVVDRQVDLYESTIELGARLGDFTPRLPHRTIATTLVALEDAFDLYALIGFEDRIEQHRNTMRALASSLLDAEV